MTSLDKQQQEIYNALSPKSKAHVDFLASLKELDRSGLLVSTLNPYSYDIEALPLYTQTRQQKWFFFSQMVTTVNYMWIYRKIDKQGLIVDWQTGFAETEYDARQQAFKLMQKDAIAFNEARLKEINEMLE